mmetsp:Transcript_12538/g.48163  ORF Transcript_12538/g.48163 Transcript_12538/m.48163 type:complete len:239 (-) Transcript_12538:117-833(-)
MRHSKRLSAVGPVRTRSFGRGAARHGRARDHVLRALEDHRYSPPKRLGQAQRSSFFRRARLGSSSSCPRVGRCRLRLGRGCCCGRDPRSLGGVGRNHNATAPTHDAGLARHCPQGIRVQHDSRSRAVLPALAEHLNGRRHSRLHSHLAAEPRAHHHGRGPRSAHEAEEVLSGQPCDSIPPCRGQAGHALVLLGRGQSRDDDELWRERLDCASRFRRADHPRKVSPCAQRCHRSIARRT